MTSFTEEQNARHIPNAGGARTKADTAFIEPSHLLYGFVREDQGEFAARMPNLVRIVGQPELRPSHSFFSAETGSAVLSRIERSLAAKTCSSRLPTKLGGCGNRHVSIRVLRFPHPVLRRFQLAWNSVRRRTSIWGRPFHSNRRVVSIQTVDNRELVPKVTHIAVNSAVASGNISQPN